MENIVITFEIKEKKKFEALWNVESRFKKKFMSSWFENGIFFLVKEKSCWTMAENTIVQVESLS